MATKALRLGRGNWARTRPTKEGVAFLGLTFFVGFAALNTGNNLLYLTFGMMLSFIATSGIIAMTNLTGIEVRPLPPKELYALTPTLMKFSLANQKFLIPSYSLTIELGGHRGYLPYLPAKSAKSLSLRVMFPRRGWNRLPAAQLYTRFPFGFFKKWIRLDIEEEEVLVYPKIERVDIDPEDFRDDEGEATGRRLGHGADIRSLRDYYYGDNPKLIHWKVSAKAGRLIMRELEDEESRRVNLEFDPGENPQSLERSIVLAASVFMELLNNNYEVDFITPTKTFSHREMGRSPKPVLTYLALYKAPSLG